MNTWLKIAIGLGVALLFGVIAGYILGAKGKGELKSALLSAEKKVLPLEDALAQKETDLQDYKKRVKLKLALCRAKEVLLHSILQLKANNFGLAEMRLIRASRHLKKAQKYAKADVADKIEKIRKNIVSAHVQTMGLDINAQQKVEAILNDVSQLPVGRTK